MPPAAPTPWHTDRWFTSPWNHDPAVAGTLRLPADIQIHDVTLRDGEQQAGVEFSADDKVQIAEALAEAGVHRIEAGLPAVSRHDEEAVRRIAALGLVDTFGVLTPHAVGRYVEQSREAFGVPLETHFHMDYGLGVANSLIAAGAGASVIQTTVGGIGERAGNTPLEETVLALLTLYDRDIGIRTERLTGLARLVMGLAGVDQPANRPVTGSRLFAVESGIIATWVRNVRGTDITEALPYSPALVGQEGPRIVLGKGSGLDNVAEALEASAIDGAADAGDDQRQRMLAEAKEASLGKRDLLDAEEFARIAAAVLHRDI
jgi:isopropylmalate/homocitrate/citramalate synthase